jgi:hypothetical protein
MREAPHSKVKTGAFLSVFGEDSNRFKVKIIHQVLAGDGWSGRLHKLMGLVEGSALLASRLLYAVEFDNYFVEWPGVFR